jgi:UDP-N-acetylmuramate dehydrogenase
MVSAPEDGAPAERASMLPISGALDAVAAALGGRARRDVPLGPRTTYRVGGAAALFVEVDSEADLGAVHDALTTTDGPVPVLVLGQGSNMLVADAGFPGLVVSLGTSFAAVSVDGCVLRAGGAAKLPVVARRSARAGLHGLEWAVGVPGSVGGAVRMNAGGHGSDVAAVLAACRVFDLVSGAAADVAPERLDLGYRTSSLSAGDVVVWAEFVLASCDPAGARAAVDAVVQWRRRHQPGGSNAGSVFTNPPGDSAGRLIEAAGLKHTRLGTAHVSAKHANFIQADDGGSAHDVWQLIEHVRAAVEASAGVRLEPEVKRIGFGEPLPAVHARRPSAGTPETRVSTSSGG